MFIDQNKYRVLQKLKLIRIQGKKLWIDSKTIETIYQLEPLELMDLHLLQ